MPEAAERARSAWAVLRDTCLRPARTGGLAVLEGPGGRRAPAWPVSQALAAAIDVGALTGDARESEAILAGLAPYRRGEAYAPLPRRRRRYLDDNAWLGLDLVRLHALTGRDAHLAEAHRLSAFVASGQDADGGVRWVEGRRSRNACVTAPAAQLALELHRRDGDPALLAFARRALVWIDATLRLPSGLIADHEDRGRVDPTVWSYNQGSTVAALALLSAATDEPEHLGRAQGIAREGLARFAGEPLWTHPPVFNAIWFRDLLALDAVEHVPGLGPSLDGYLERAWTRGRDPATGLFTAGGIGAYDGTPAIDHAGIVQLLALRARAA